jgi:hypothetical protein
MRFDTFWNSIPQKPKVKEIKISKKTKCLVCRDDERIYILGVKQKAGSKPLAYKKAKAKEHYSNLQKTTKIAGAYFTGLFWNSKIKN